MGLRNLTRDHKNAKRLLVMGTLVAFILFVVDIVKFWKLVHQYSVISMVVGRSLPPPSSDEAIVVLAGDQLRIPRAFELLQTRKKAFLLISGTGKKTKLTDLVNQQKDASVNIHGVWNKIFLESESTSTWENAVEARRLLTPRAVKRIILVTSDYHMYRAAKIFRLLLPDFQIIEFPINSRPDDEDRRIYGSAEYENFIWHSLMEYWKCYWLKLRLLYSFVF